MIDLKNIIINTPTEALEKVIAPFIEEQFPSFMRRDYRKLVMFIKAYYEWMDKQGNPGSVVSNLSSVYDIDRSLEEYYSHFKNTYLDGFPDVLATNTSGRKPNKNTLLKQIRDFYGNKGTENAYKFLFRVLYDSDVDFYYPKEDVLKTSDGRWIEKVSLKTTSSNGSTLFSAKGQSVYQYIGNQLVASAEVDSVVQYNQDGYEITEFFLNNLVGNFVSTVPVTFIVDGQQYQETVFSVLSDFFIQTPGSDFRVGDEIYITDDKGTGFSAFIEQTGLGGTIKKIGVKNSGINYFNTVTVSFISQTGNLSSAVVFARPTAVTRYPGYYSNNSGKLSSTKKIQDGHYYQDFSYELKSAVSLDTYFSVLKDLIHPAGMRMFGSILVNDALQNTPNTSAQGTFFRDPIIGNYTPYTSGTTLDLRANGLTGGGGWCGAEGDLYPLGYNPYIGSTSEVGPSGKTAPLGTLFYGTSLGYTYCIVPEGGKTAHDPLGAPLGSTTAWFNGKETALTPEGMRGLVLWLKPENIGVCGAVANGASVDVWRDASPSRNHAVPPTWDKWNGVSDIWTNASATAWTRSVHDATNPITKLSFLLNGKCGGFTTDRLFMAGLNSDPATNASFTSIDYAIYSYGPFLGGLASRRLIAYESNKQGPDLVTASADSSFHDNTVCEIEYAEPNIVYRVNGVSYRTVYAGYGLTFYADTSGYSGAGTSIKILEMSYKGTPVVPSWVVTGSGITVENYAGLTVDKLRPTLQTAAAGGATGISFNGGLVFSPQTTYGGISLAQGISMGFTAAGSSAEKLMNGQHMYLKRPLKITDDADIFIVYKTTLEGVSYGYGLLASRNSNAIGNNLRMDSVLFSRSYNSLDRNPSVQNSSYYSVLPNGTLFYPGASLPPAGLVGFRPQGDTDGALQNFIAYDPHVSGVCMGICVGEARRDSSNRIESFLNGDIATNQSPTTGRSIISLTAPQSDNFIVTKNLVYSFDPGKTACLDKFVLSKNKNLLDPYPLTETSIDVLAPLSPSMFRRDGTTVVPAVTRVTQDGGENLGSDEVYEFIPSSSKNVYINTPSAWRNASLLSTTWTFTATIRKEDGSAITSANVYIYGLGSNDSAAGTIENLGNGWYKVTRTKTGTTPTNVTLVGLTGLADGVKYRIGRIGLYPFPATSDISGVGLRSSYPTGYTRYGTALNNEVGYRNGPWGKQQIVWEALNFSTINTNASFNGNGGFYAPAVPIDSTKLYRFSVWVNRAVAGNGNVYFGNNESSYQRSNGSSTTNPYFSSNGSTSLPYDGKQNQWVLLVGHIHPSGSASGANHPNSGFYTVGSGTTYASLSEGDKIWQSGTSSTVLRTFLYGSSIPGTLVYFAQPRIDLIDGNEVSIEELTDNIPNTVYDLSASGNISEVYDYVGYSSSDGNGSAVFDAKGGLITSKNGLNLGDSGNSTWEAWIKPALGNITAKTNYMYMGAGGRPFFNAPSGDRRASWILRLGTTTYGINSPVGSVPAGVWSNVVCVAQYDGSYTTMKMYINGNLVESQKFSGKQTYDVSNPFLTIGDRRPAQNQSDYPGRRSVDGLGFNWGYEGSVSCVRVYSRALNDLEIRQNFNSLRNRFGV